MSKRNIIVIIVILILLIALPLGLYLVQKQQILKSRASTTQSTQTTCPVSTRTLPGDIDSNGCISDGDYTKWLRDKNNNVYSSPFSATCDYKEWLKANSLGTNSCN